MREREKQTERKKGACALALSLTQKLQYIDVAKIPAGPRLLM